jgi:1-phosphatidylinositol phosphodiesterase
MGTNGGTEENIIWKYNATSAHIDEATKNNLDQLYITFASAEHNAATPPVTPRV